MSKKDKLSLKEKPKKGKSKNTKTSSSLSDLDLHLLGEGNHFKSYEKLGSKFKHTKKKSGVQFTVWAPNAKSVSVVGEFNNWNPDDNNLSRVNASGYWDLFIPGIGEGEMYKYAVKSGSGEVIFKSDPYALRAELRPGTASIVHTLNKHKWNDDEWMIKRRNSSAANPGFKKNPVSIYEVHAGSWKKDFENEEHKNEWGYKSYRQLAHELVDYAKDMHYTHIELLPVMEHPLDISWGYQVINYFAPSSRYGSPEDFMYFIDHCHQNNIGVILDWVPSHFPTDVHGFGNFDGKEIYAYENPAKGFHKEWGTHVFDYGKNEVMNFLISNALFWFDKYHIDGLRVDAVASMLYLDYSRNEGEWMPNIHGGNENLEAVAFLKKLNETLHKKHKGIMVIAEESSAWPGVTAPVHLGGLGFDMKWNMGWMHDTLAYFAMDPVFRKFHHGKLTFSIWYAFSEKFLLPLSHDEVVHLKKTVIEKMPGDQWQKFANARLLYGYMFAHPGKKLNFMGNDIAQYNEWNSEASLDWNVLEYEFNKKFHLYFKEFGKLYCEHSAFYEVDFESKGFQWIDFSDSDNSVIAFVRYNHDKSETLLFTFNMTPVIREKYLLGVPEKGFYKEIMNSNAEEYGGSGTGNYGGVWSTDELRFEFTNSVRVTLPPLSVNVYKFEPMKDSVVAEDVEETKVVQTEESTEVLSEENASASVAVVSVIEKPETIEEQLPVTDNKSEEEFIPAVKPTDELTEDEMAKKIKEIVNRIKKF
ncbi:MAG: 1,4-alpha-glucan branching protein GlgB [bacterium]|nr:1,4-alpha-glucan branching protein GlgB [bacterium]